MRQKGQIDLSALSSCAGAASPHNRALKQRSERFALVDTQHAGCCKVTAGSNQVQPSSTVSLVVGLTGEPTSRAKNHTRPPLGLDVLLPSDDRGLCPEAVKPHGPPGDIIQCIL